jgi:hypothetical protein
VLAAGAKGILFSSVITGGNNIVLYTDSLAAPDLLEINDPNGMLPKSQALWA